MRAPLSLLSLLPGLLLASAPPGDPARIDEAVRAIGRADYRSALVTLDAAVQDLSARPEAKVELARAYLYLGVAYGQLGEKSLANSRFLRALDLDAELAKRHADAIRALPVSARDAFNHAVLEHRRLRANQQSAKKRSWTGLALLGGAGVAAGAGLALARGKEDVIVQQETITAPERTNKQPVVTITVEPGAGIGIVCLTTFGFTASASDPDGEPLKYEWDFGDGEKDSGPIVNHRYSASGTQHVTLKVSDGLSSVTATKDVTVKALQGRWRFEHTSLFGLDSVEFLAVYGGEACTGPDLVQFELTATWNGESRPDSSYSVTGRRPTRIEFNVYWWERQYYTYFVGELDSNFDRISGTVYEMPPWGCTGCGKSDAVALIRQ
jgi:hypothetical protein